MSFSYEVKELNSGEYSLRLSGQLDEDATLPKINELPRSEKLIIDFSKVDFINSRGIKSWILFVNEIVKFPDYNILFRGCPRIIVGQINSIEGFLPKNAKVESVYLDLFCDDCQEDFRFYYNVLNSNSALDDDEIIDKFLNSQSPEADDNKCKHEFVELDFAPEKFFVFLEKQTS